MAIFFERSNVLYVLGNDKVENDQPPEAANVPLRSTREQMVTEPPSTDKSVERPSLLAHHLRKLTTMQLPPKELSPLKWPLEAALELKTSKLFVISTDFQNFRFQKSSIYAFWKKLLVEVNPMFYTIIYYVQRRAASRYLPIK